MKLLSQAAIALLGLTFSAYSQNELDVARYSQTAPLGTARSLGLAGAFSAVGADFSSAYLNPAGLGLYKRNDFMFTSGIKISGTESSYLGQNTVNNKGNFGITNVGVVFADENPGFNGQHPRGITSWAFAIGMNQLDNYHRNTSSDSYNPSSSFTDFIASRANGNNYDTSGIQLDDSYSGLGYQTGMIWWNGTKWMPSVAGGNIDQRFSRDERGRTNAWNISGAVTIDQKLSIGGAINITDLIYSSNTTYFEDDSKNIHDNLNGDTVYVNTLEMSDYVRTTGAGVNASFGMLFKPVDYFRMGVAIQSPTFYNMRDRYQLSMTTSFDSLSGTFTANSNPSMFNYNLVTSYRVTGGMAIIFGKYGFLSADAEMYDYSTGSLMSPSTVNPSYYYSFNSENSAISRDFGPAVNIRVGGELRLDKFRLRAGYGTYGNVMKESARVYTDENGIRHSYTAPRNVMTGGFGYKEENFYIDLAFVHQVQNEYFSLYNTGDPSRLSPTLGILGKKNTVYMTVGFTF